MSDISALSHDYEATAEFAQQMNTAVLDLKRSVKGRHRTRAKPEQTAHLADILSAVKSRLESSEGKPDIPVPEGVIERLQTEHKKKLNYLIEDLSNAEQALRGSGSVTSEVLDILDEVCDAADASASAMFRRLRRR